MDNVNPRYSKVPSGSMGADLATAVVREHLRCLVGATRLTITFFSFQYKKLSIPPTYYTALAQYFKQPDELGAPLTLVHWTGQVRKISGHMTPRLLWEDVLELLRKAKYRKNAI